MPSGQVPSSRPPRTRCRARAGSAGPENKEAADHLEKVDLRNRRARTWKEKL